MNNIPLIVADADIPFLRGRLEPYATMRYLGQDEFTKSNIADADAMIIRTRTRCNDALLRGTSVKAIATATIGMDQFNIPECEALGIAVCNAPGCNAPGVAQYVWASLLRIIPDPKGMRLAVVGCGNVGKIVKEWGEMLGAEVKVSDPPLEKQGAIKGYPLEELMQWADAITFHTPYTTSAPHPTHHLLNEQNASLLRREAVVINAARGPVTSTKALKQVIREKNIKAIIDCWEGEPTIDKELLELAHTATYHIAGYSLEGKQRATRMAVKAICDFFGFTPDLSDLAPDYVPGRCFSSQEIISSFDPQPVMTQLRANPEMFDRMRADYKYRKEL